MSRLLLRGRYVVTDPTDLPRTGMLEDAGVLVESGHVVEVGGWSDLRDRFPDLEVIGTERHLVLPGFVNAHHHGRGLSGVQLAVQDDYLERWLLDFIAMPPLDVYLDTLYANLRMLRSGVTTVLHSAYAREPKANRTETVDALRAYRDAGLRVAYAVGIEDAVKLVFGDEESLLASLDDALAARARAIIAPPDAGSVDNYFALVESLAEQHRDDQNVRILYGPSWHVWCSPRLLERVVREADRTGLGIHMHVLESPLERTHAHAMYGTDVVSYLAGLGLLGPHTSLAHGTWLDDDDIDVCASTGTSVCHNASSNLRLRNGIAPVNRLIARGVTVGLGADSWGPNSDDDMLAEMRLAASLQRLPSEPRFASNPPSPPCVDCFDWLRMLTVNGVRAAGFDVSFGRLIAGSPADAVLIDYDAMTTPYIDPAVHPVAAWMHLAQSTHVDLVVVGGQVVHRVGASTKVDEASIAAELGEIARRSPSPGHAQLRATVNALKPHIARHYDG